TDIPLFTFSFFRQAFWDKPDDWLAHSSLMYVGRVTTPTLLMTGELDRRTPIPQTEEYYAALKIRNVPTVMLRFNGEYHGTGSKQTNFMRTQLYMMSWFEKHRRSATEPPTGAGDRYFGRRSWPSQPSSLVCSSRVSWAPVLGGGGPPRDLVGDQPRCEPRVPADVVEAACGVVVVSHEVQARLVQTHDPVAATREALRVDLDQASQGPERCSESGGEDDLVEPPRC